MAGLVMLFTAPGLAILGWFLSHLGEGVLSVLIGIAFLVGFVGIGLLADSGRPHSPRL